MQVHHGTCSDAHPLPLPDHAVPTTTANSFLSYNTMEYIPGDCYRWCFLVVVPLPSIHPFVDVVIAERRLKKIQGSRRMPQIINNRSIASAASARVEY